jgi:hypothetical protein
MMLSWPDINLTVESSLKIRQIAGSSDRGSLRSAKETPALGESMPNIQLDFNLLPI